MYSTASNPDTKNRRPAWCVVGQRVTFNGGYPGTIVAIPSWSNALIEVRGDRSAVCIDFCDAKPVEGSR